MRTIFIIYQYNFIVIFFSGNNAENRENLIHALFEVDYWEANNKNSFLDIIINTNMHIDRYLDKEKDFFVLNYFCEINNVFFCEYFDNLNQIKTNYCLCSWNVCNQCLVLTKNKEMKTFKIII